MSSGGVFKLIINDGKADRMIMATKLLNQRIRDIMCARRDAGKADITPTLVDLERTHLLFVNAHFKPYAAVGFEYNKVRPQSGSPTLGNSVTYSIPQFGDFFNDMVHHTTHGTATTSTHTAPTQDTGTLGMTATAYPQDGTDWDGTPLVGATYSLEDSFGNPIADTSPTHRNLVRYCEYPGERLHQNVKFDVNGNPLDEYNDVTSNMIRKFTIGADKIQGYNRLVGQENPMMGHSGPILSQAEDADNNGAQPVTQIEAGGADIAAFQNHSNPVPTSTADHMNGNFPDASWVPNETTSGVRAATQGWGNIVRKRVQAVDGPQTPKYVQPALDMWNKLRFWFNDDTRLSVPSVSIPFGQRFITMDLASRAQLLHEHTNTYVRQTVDLGAVAGATASTGSLAAPNMPNGTADGNSRTVTYRPHTGGSGTISGGDITQPELYVNNIFVNPEVHDIFIKRIGFSLIRVWRQHSSRTNTNDDEKLLSQLKWPIEYMFVGIRPKHNTSTTNPNQHSDWHRMSKMHTYDTQDYHHAEINLASGAADTTVIPGLANHRSRIGERVATKYVRHTPTVDNMSVTAHGIPINDNFPQRFYSSYNPFNYGGAAINTPDDEGAMMVNFSLFPGSYQPAGHVNVSRAREFYLKWTGKYSGSNTEADLHVIAKAINFLLVTDGSAVLRYST